MMPFPLTSATCLSASESDSTVDVEVEVDVEVDVEVEVKAQVEEAIQFAEESPLPKAHELYEDVYVTPDYPFVND